MGIYKNNNPATGKTLLWADRNLGAQAAASLADNYQDYGFLFAWGEIVPYFEAGGWQASWEMKPDMTQAKYYWYDSVAGSYSKYTTPGDVLETQDDAASAYLGNGWRMPTNAELAALWNLSKTRDIYWGYTVSDKLFFPLAGRRQGTSQPGRGNSGFNNYWSATKGTIDKVYYNYGESTTTDDGYPYFGMAVRPVKEVQAISNLVHYWPFNGGLNDAIGGIEATNWEAALTTDRYGNADKAYYFNGGNQMRISNAGSFDNSTSFTFNVWVCTTQEPYSTGRNLIRTDEGNGSNGWYVRFISGGRIEIWESGYVANSTNSYNDGNWHMITYVRDVTGLKGTLYVDGIEKCSYPMSSGVANVENSKPHYLGSYGGGEFYEGKMDEVRLYDKALTAAEVAALYQY